MNDHSIKVSYIASLLVCFILSIVLRRERITLLNSLFIIYRPQTSLEDRRMHLPMLYIDFPIQTSRTYFSRSERANATAASPSSFCNQAMQGCALFLQTRNWNVSQLRVITPITPSVAKRLKGGRKRGDGRCWCGSCILPI